MQLAASTIPKEVYKGLWTEPAGALSTLSINQQEPMNNLVVEDLLGVEQHRRESVQFMKNYYQGCNDFLLTRVLPVRGTTDTKVRFNEWIFDPQLAGRVPELTVSPMVSVHGNAREQGLRRFGKGARISYDTMMTEEGKQLWRMHLENIGESSTNVMKLDVARELFNVRMDICMRNIYMLRFPYMEFDRMIGEEIEFFGLMSKGPTLFPKILTEVRRQMELNGAKPGHLIMPPDSVYFLKNQVNKIHRTMLMSGPRAALLQNGYNYSVSKSSFNTVPSIEGMEVFELSRVHELSTIGPVDPSMTTREIGMHFILSDTSSYTYSIDQDTMIKQNQLDYLERLQLWNVAGNDWSGEFKLFLAMQSNVDGVTNGGRIFSRADWRAGTFQDFLRISPEYFGKIRLAQAKLNIPAATVNGLLATPMNVKENWMNLLRQNLPIPLNIAVVYPRVKVNMCSAVVLEIGSGTGNLYVAFNDMQEAINPETKELMGNMTIWSKAVIRDRSKVSVIPNVKFAGFVEMGQPEVMAMALDETADTKPIIDIKGTGSQLPIFNELKVHAGDKLDYAFRQFYSQIREYPDKFPDYDPSKPFYADETIPNRLSFQTTQYNYNPSKKDYSAVISSKGHIPDEGNQPGGKAVIQGLQLYYDPLNLKKVMGYCV